MSAHIPRTEYANAGRSIGGAYASLAAASGLTLSDILLLAERDQLHRAMPCVEVRARERRRIAGAHRSRQRLLEVQRKRWGTADDDSSVATGPCPGCSFGGYRPGTPCAACTYDEPTGPCPGCSFGGYRPGTACAACTYNGEPATY
jgi:hypothetical protein